jgi:uncharacterized membrane protein
MTTASHEPENMPSNVAAMTPTLRRTGLILVFLWFLFGGVAHFSLTEVEMRIVPPAIPWPRAAVLVSGVFELLGAVGILIPATRRAAGIGLFLLTIAVTPANVYMLQHAELFSVPRWALIVRLPFQVVLLALILWSTWTPNAIVRRQ